MKADTNKATNQADVKVRTGFKRVYTVIAIATFFHSAWGFGTINGPMPDFDSNPVSFGWWWTIGGLSAFVVDVGMGHIVYSMLVGWYRNWQVPVLILLSFLSAFSQLVYSAAHAAPLVLSAGVAPEIAPILQSVLIWSPIVFPLALPLFALIYAFAVAVKDPVIIAETEQAAEVKSAINWGWVKAKFAFAIAGEAQTRESQLTATAPVDIATETPVNIARPKPLPAQEHLLKDASKPAAQDGDNLASLKDKWGLQEEKLSKPEREEFLVQFFASGARLSQTDLAKLLDISESTLSRDLARLAQDNDAPIVKLENGSYTAR